jgi:prepilin-type N-terminal cleavage/methylation domain-containing protein
LRAEEGMTLIELLIAMAVMSIGIAALVAGFSSGIVSINRARTTSTAGTLADHQMELYRQASFTSLPVGLQLPTTPVGADGQTYWMQVDGVWTCAVPGSTYSGDPHLPGPPASCSDNPPGIPASRPVKLLTIEVRDPATAKLLFTESATFDSSTG